MHNADPTELQKFTDLAAEWWDLNGPMKPLHQINPLRLDFIQQGGRLAGKRVLDVGCGGGILSEAMARAGAQVMGLDLSEAALAAARKHADLSGLTIEYLAQAVENLAETHAGQFDTVTCMEMLEHVPDPASVVAACAKLVKSGGQVVFSTLNRHPKAFMLAIVGAEYVLNWVPRGTHEYEKFIKPSELTAWARQVGLDSENLTGLHYHPLRRSYQLGRDTDVNYLLRCRK